MCEYGCISSWPGNEPGRDVVHAFTTSYIRSNIIATLSNLTSDLDVFILQNNQCETNNCIADNNSATYNNAPRGTHYIVVDGYSSEYVGNCEYTMLGAEGAYTLTVEEQCIANDLILGVPFDYETNGRPSSVSYYNCSGWTESGPEVVHKVTTTRTGDLRAELSNLGGVDLDVFILSDCTADSCLPGAFGDNAAVYPNAPPGTYYIVVDGYNGASGPYTLTASNPCEGVVCNDGDACTTDTCNPSTGSCVYSPKDCGDGDACTNDACFATGVCIHSQINCNDGDACTTDTCNTSTGCQYTTLSCNDSNLCTNDFCNPETGCEYLPITCGGGDIFDRCNIYSCNPSTGCETTPVNCDDGNACTVDGCNPLTGCVYSPLSCDDGDACTTDSCNASTGCQYTLNDTDRDGAPDCIDQDDDNDRLPDDWERFYNLDPLDNGSVNPDFGAGGDPDQDRYTNDEEFLAGTDPRNSDSHPNLPPESVIDTPADSTTIIVGEGVFFSGTGSSLYGNLPLTYHWNFGAGSGIPDSQMEDPGEVIFNNPGIFTVSLTVTDSSSLPDPTPATVQVEVDTIPVTKPAEQVASLQLLKEQSSIAPIVRFERGIPRFVEARVELPLTVKEDPVVKAIYFLDRFKNLYRLYDPKSQLYLDRIVFDKNAGQHLFFGQHLNGIPVFAAQLSEHIYGNTVLGTNGNYLAEIPWFQRPEISADDAGDIAMQEAPGTLLEIVGEARLMYFNKGLITGNEAETHLAWHWCTRRAQLR